LICSEEMLCALGCDLPSFLPLLYNTVTIFLCFAVSSSQRNTRQFYNLLAVISDRVRLA
jgi:hypothetical protein